MMQYNLYTIDLTADSNYIPLNFRYYQQQLLIYDKGFIEILIVTPILISTAGITPIANQYIKIE